MPVQGTQLKGSQFIHAARMAKTKAACLGSGKDVGCTAHAAGESSAVHAVHVAGGSRAACTVGGEGFEGASTGSVVCGVAG